MKIEKDKIMRAAVYGRCPQCLESSIFTRFVDIKDKCDNCGFDLKKHDIGDGAVFFATLFVGAQVAFLAYLLDSYKELSFYSHILIWTPTIIFGVVLTLRLFKSFLLSLQYYFRKSDFDKN